MPEQDGQNGNGTQDASADANQQEEPFVFAKWLEAQDERVRGGYDDDVKGLKSALQNERTTRETLERNVRKLTGDVEKGSKLQQELEKLSTDLAETNTKAGFFREAHAEKVIDLELAWLAAKNGNLFDRQGAVDMRALREAHPALFAATKTTVPPANAGNGVGQDSAKSFNMNDAIRASARGR